MGPFIAYKLGLSTTYKSWDGPPSSNLLENSKQKHTNWRNLGRKETPRIFDLTPRKTNMQPTNWWLEYVEILVSFWDGQFSGAMLVSGRVSQTPNECLSVLYIRIMLHVPSAIFLLGGGHHIPE